MKQLDFLDRGGPPLAFGTGGSEPRLWVRRLVVWSEPGVELREVRLRPGLNILWAPDPAEKGDAPDDDLDVVGHGSGKTLFCRLLRYCLGEDRFAPDDHRDHIAHAFPKGLVGAEVAVDGVTWAVVRPIGMGGRHWVVRDAHLDQVVKGNGEAGGMDPLLDAIAATFALDELVAVGSGERPRDAWRLALAWLSRDQECRFDKLLDWRSADSNSRSPARNLSVQQLLDTVRALIGAIVPDEPAIRTEIAKLEAKRGQIRDQADRRASEAASLRSRLIDELRLDSEGLLPDRMAVESLRNAAKTRLDGLRKTGTDPAADMGDLGDLGDLDVLRSESDAVQRQVQKLQNDLSVVQARMPEIEALISRIEGEIPGASARTHGAEHLICPLCEVPVDRVLAEGCKLSRKLPDLKEVKRRQEQLCLDHKREQSRLQENREEERCIARELNPARERADALHRRLRAVEHARDEQSEAWFAARRLLDDVDRLDRSLVEEESMRSRADALEDEIRTKRDRLAALRDEQAGVFDRLSGTFHTVIRAVLGSNASGTIFFDGNGLRSSVELGGERSTAAIDSLKVIAFDLAVMCTSIEGDTHLPAFLIHDSPREADLGLGVYHRLFRFARDLEGGDQPPFQYIVTTTTSPPDELRLDPWLVETLGGSAAERLLKRDL